MTEYLPEDQDLLNEMEGMGATSTGLAFSQQQRKLDVIQIKSILRSRKTMSDLDRSTSRYSIVLIIFTIGLIVLATAQFVFDVVNSQHIWIGVGLIVLCVIFIGILMKKLDPDEILKK